MLLSYRVLGMIKTPCNKVLLLQKKRIMYNKSLTFKNAMEKDQYKPDAEVVERVTTMFNQFGDQLRTLTQGEMEGDIDTYQPVDETDLREMLKIEESMEFLVETVPAMMQNPSQFVRYHMGIHPDQRQLKYVDGPPLDNTHTLSTFGVTDANNPRLPSDGTEKTQLFITAREVNVDPPQDQQEFDQLVETYIENAWNFLHPGDGARINTEEWERLKPIAEQRLAYFFGRRLEEITITADTAKMGPNGPSFSKGAGIRVVRYPRKIEVYPIVHRGRFAGEVHPPLTTIEYNPDDEESVKLFDDFSAIATTAYHLQSPGRR